MAAADLTNFLVRLYRRLDRTIIQKRKKHQVFRLSFDAKEVVGNEAIVKVLDYIHHNPVSGKWELVDDFVDYPYSSAKFYELGEQREIKVWDYRDMDSEVLS